MDNKLTFQNWQIHHSELMISLILYKRKDNLFIKNYLMCANKGKCSNCTKALIKTFWANLLNISYFPWYETRYNWWFCI